MSKIRIALVALMLPAASWSAEAHLGKSLAEWKAEVNSDVRVERLIAVRALGEMAIAGRRDALEPLFAALKHEDSAARYWAAVAIGRLGEAGRPAEKHLVAALDDEAPEVRVWAGYALVRLGRADKGMKALTRDLKNPEKGARLQAVHAIDELGTEARAATDALKISIKDEFDYVQRVSRHALWILGERPCPYRSCQ